MAADALGGEGGARAHFGGERGGGGQHAQTAPAAAPHGDSRARTAVQPAKRAAMLVAVVTLAAGVPANLLAPANAP